MPTFPTREEQVTQIKDIFVSLMWIAARQFSHRLQPFGLTHAQFIVLASLAAHQQSCPMRDLTDVTFQDPPTMTGIIDRMVKMGLVERARSQADRRVVLVEATSAGLDLVRRIKEDATRVDLDGFATFTDGELATLEESLKQLLRIHVEQYMSLKGADLDAEIEKLQNFRSDPVYYMKSKSE
jgi:DNA-binding MarR family transcriptional regulator